jgi:hypothetical protein
MLQVLVFNYLLLIIQTNIFTILLKSFYFLVKIFQNIRKIFFFSSFYNIFYVLLAGDSSSNLFSIIKMTKIGAPVKIASFEGQDVMEIEMVSETGTRVRLLNYAALVRDWQVPVGGGGEMRSVVCGFDQFAPYPEHSPYFGAIVGRVANRIGDSRFELDGTEYKLPANNGVNHLHGGPRGLAKQVCFCFWDLFYSLES